jgi:hypothetical protein
MPIVRGPVLAYHNHGRWVADCSDPECDGAELVERGQKFVCGSCHRRDWLNQQQGKVFANGTPVRFPSQANQRAIERVLQVRPMNARNWWEGESIKELKRENREHGLPEEVWE